MKKQRLDEIVFSRGFTPSRERAKTTVMAGLVYVDGKRNTKPGSQISPDCEIEIRGETLPYVSRGGLKLEKALDVFGIDPNDMLCIDCGASTGGFTDCLLKRGARCVYAVDVGYGQLAWSLREDSRVISMERTNIRYVVPSDFPERFDIAVMDLSFISLRLILPVIRRLLREGGQAVCLVKPQFEAGREKVGKKGVVRDRAVHAEVLEKFLSDARSTGFSVTGLTFSPVRGPEGNIEYLAHLNLAGEKTSDCVVEDICGCAGDGFSNNSEQGSAMSLDAIVNEAHDCFESQKGN